MANCSSSHQIHSPARELWTSFSTGETFRVADIAVGNIDSNPSDLAIFDDLLFFIADDGFSGRQIWLSDGSSFGTAALLGENIYVDIPRSLTPFQDQFVFVADDGNSGAELWTTDGTASGTRLLIDLRDGPNGSQPDGLTIVGDRLYSQLSRRRSGANCGSPMAVLRGLG